LKFANEQIECSVDCKKDANACGQWQSKLGTEKAVRDNYRNHEKHSQASDDPHHCVLYLTANNACVDAVNDCVYHYPRSNIPAQSRCESVFFACEDDLSRIGGYCDESDNRRFGWMEHHAK
jgi:hypothetical protein